MLVYIALSLVIAPLAAAHGGTSLFRHYARRMERKKRFGRLTISRTDDHLGVDYQINEKSGNNIAVPSVGLYRSLRDR
jgi:hypothetical protein